MWVAGIDACPGGWVAVVLAGPGVVDVGFRGGLAELVAAYPDVGVVGVDMPLGLLARGWRQADRLAAERLGAQRSRVFRIPPGPVWDEPAFARAVTRCRELTEPAMGFSVQAWALRPKLQQAAALRAAQPGLLFEVHPELSFAALNDGTPVAASKKTWNGQMRRRSLLAAAGVRLPDHLVAAGPVPPDDVLDAAAVAWSAGRIARGEAVVLPDPPECGQDGQPIAIRY